MDWEFLRQELVDVVVRGPRDRVVQNHRNEWPQLWAVIDKIVAPELEVEPSLSEKIADEFWQNLRKPLVSLVQNAIDVSEMTAIERETYPLAEVEATFEGDRLVSARERQEDEKVGEKRGLVDLDSGYSEAE